MTQHFHGKVAIKIFLTDEIGNLLVCRQNQDEDFEVVGGRVDVEESLMSCMQREILEELGVNVDCKNYKIIDSFQALNPNENIQHLYLIVNIGLANEIKSKIVKTEEVKEIIWINKNNYKNNIYKKFLENQIENFLINLNK